MGGRHDARLPCGSGIGHYAPAGGRGSHGLHELHHAHAAVHHDFLRARFRLVLPSRTHRAVLDRGRDMGGATGSIADLAEAFYVWSAGVAVAISDLLAMGAVPPAQVAGQRCPAYADVKEFLMTLPHPRGCTRLAFALLCAASMLGQTALAQAAGDPPQSQSAEKNRIALRTPCRTWMAITLRSRSLRLPTAPARLLPPTVILARSSDTSWRERFGPRLKASQKRSIKGGRPSTKLPTAFTRSRPTRARRDRSSSWRILSVTTIRSLASRRLKTRAREESNHE